MLKDVPEDATLLWVVDTWQRSTTAAAQNEDKDMKVAWGHLEALGEAFDGPVIGCFHPPKSNPKTISGSGFQQNATVAIWEIAKTDPESDSSLRELKVTRMS